MAKFFRRGISKAYFLPAVAGVSPTRPEITAGVNLGAQMTALTGFQFTNSRIATPVLDNRFTQQIAGEDTVADSSFTFLDDDASNTVRNALAKGTAGFVVFMPYGDVATKRCEVWPATSTGVNDAWDLGNAAATYTVGFAITGPPTQNATIPA